MPRSRTWTCRKCRIKWPRTRQKCSACGARRPDRKTAAQKALADPYEVWVQRFGETCNICGRAPSATRRLDRDHDHASGEARGLLCHTCNRALGHFITADWLRRATDYLERPR